MVMMMIMMMMMMMMMLCQEAFRLLEAESSGQSGNVAKLESALEAGDWAKLTTLTKQYDGYVRGGEGRAQGI
jgi:hypothetical protein